MSFSTCAAPDADQAFVLARSRAFHDLNRAWIIKPNATLGARNVLTDIVRVPRRLDLDLIGNADDADQCSDGLPGGFLLELPVDFTVERVKARICWKRGAGMTLPAA